MRFESVTWSPGWTGGFPPGTPVSFHTNANIGTNENDLYKLYNCFVIVK